MFYFIKRGDREDIENLNPTEAEINDFISREVVLKRLLSRYFSAVDLTKLPESSLEKLIKFSRECFKIVWSETKSTVIIEKIKNLDSYTERLMIPSRSGKDIASSLKLRFDNV